MAPVTLAGALSEQNAEALAGMVLTQVVRPGAPVIYGGFTSNVDMQSGAPAFGTPEYMRTAMIGGQLARRYGVPYRSSNVSAAQRARRPGGLRVGLLAVGRDHGRRQPADARRRLDGGRPPRQLREDDPRRRAARDGRGVPGPGRRRRRHAGLRGDARRSGRAATSSAPSTRSRATRPRSTSRCSATGGTTRRGRRPARRSCRRRPTGSGRSCSPRTSRRRWTRPSPRSSQAFVDRRVAEGGVPTDY